MPHDANGKLLNPGDEVLIPATVESVQPCEQYCNTTVKLKHPMPPYTEDYKLTLNTQQVVKKS